MIHRITIRKATEEDLPSVYKLLQTEGRSIQCLQEYNEEDVRQHILNGKVWVSIHAGGEKGDGEKIEPAGMVGAMGIHITPDARKTPIMANVLFLVCRNDLRIEGVASSLAGYLINFHTMGVTWCSEWICKGENPIMAGIWQRMKFAPETDVCKDNRIRYVGKVLTPIITRYDTLKIRFIPG